jgi:hypothetical protein
MEHKWSVSPSPGDYNLCKEPQIPTGQDIELELEACICNDAPKIASAGSSGLSLESPASSMNLRTRKPKFKDQTISVECGCKQHVQPLKDPVIFERP